MDQIRIPAGSALLLGMMRNLAPKVNKILELLIYPLAVHMPQPIRVERSLFTPVNNGVFVTGRENWTSFGSTPSAPVAINSVPVQIENQSTSKDLISL